MNIKVSTEKHVPYFLTKYQKCAPDLAKQFNLWKAPKLEKIVIHCRFGKYMQDKSIQQLAFDVVKLISGQMPAKRYATKSMAPKVREGMYSSIISTLRRDAMYEFWARLWCALPRIRNFEGFKKSACDSTGGFSITIKDWTSFLECDAARLDLKNASLIELGICIKTTAKNSEETSELLEKMGLPLRG